MEIIKVGHKCEKHNLDPMVDALMELLERREELPGTFDKVATREGVIALIRERYPKDACQECIAEIDRAHDEEIRKRMEADRTAQYLDARNQVPVVWDEENDPWRDR